MTDSTPEMMAETTAPRQPSQRFYDLDVLRAVAMLMGVLTHATMFVQPVPVFNWPLRVESVGDDDFYKLLLDWISGFRMPVFFVVSGFFAGLVWQRRGLRAYIAQRLRRVGIPFVVAVFTVLPLTVGMLAVIAHWEGVYDFEPYLLPLVSFGTTGQFWFLWYLLIYAAVIAGLIRLGVQFDNPMVWWLAIPVTFAASVFMQGAWFGADTRRTLIPDAPSLVYYLAMFMFGIFIYRRGIDVQRWWTVGIVIGIGFFVVAQYALQTWIDTLPTEDLTDPSTWTYAFREPSSLLIAVLAETAYAWVMVFGTMGLFRWIASRKSAVSQYMSDASYWIYISHVPIVIALQWLIVDWTLHYHLKYLLVVAVTIAITLVTYEYVVRYTFIGAALNGRRERAPRTDSRRPGVRPV